MITKKIYILILLSSLAMSCSEQNQNEEGEGKLEVSGNFVISSGKGEVKISNTDKNENLVIQLIIRIPDDWSVILPEEMANNPSNEMLIPPMTEVKVTINTGESCIFKDYFLEYVDGNIDHPEPRVNENCINFSQEINKKRCGEVRIVSSSGGGCAILDVWK
jgi:hypothetical protein